ncbi:RE1 [Symbiodinium sp. CCMP2456]|nr:RE1 [Symbiodinium sp. CCMP2456]
MTLGAPTVSSTTAAFLAKSGFPLEGTGVERVYNSEVEMEDEEITTSESEKEPQQLENKVKVLRYALEQEGKDYPDKYQQLVEERLEWGQALLRERDRRDLRRVAKVSPGEAGDYEVEEILGGLCGPLEVVHNVSLPEARRHLDKWKAAILKEVEALVNSGTVRRLSAEQARELKKQGMVVLPGKAVFTARPPSDQGGDDAEKFRRKCRIVVCGNYLPSDKANVFASGTSADGLRVSVAFTVFKRWAAAATDISNAFTLAPMPTDRLFGMTPPAIVTAAGGASPGETWVIQRVLYGLREAPRWWGVFRNERMANARIPFGDEVIILACLETEENIWRIYFEGCSDIQGILLIYVDDLLLLSMPGIIETIYQWLTAEWKCSPLQWMDQEYLRFLGVELRTMGSGIHVSQVGSKGDWGITMAFDEVATGVGSPCGLYGGKGDKDNSEGKWINVRCISFKDVMDYGMRIDQQRPVKGKEVMSPSGIAAQGRETTQRRSQMLNGVDRVVGPSQGVDQDDGAFRQALETGSGATSMNTGPGATATNAATGISATADGSSPIVPTGEMMTSVGSGQAEVFTTATEIEGRSRDPPLLPHAAVEHGVPTNEGDSMFYNRGPESWTECKFYGYEVVFTTRPGIEATVLHETVWSPSRARTTAEAAPESESSGSYSREQLEAEENQRLRQQVERLSREAAQGRETDRRQAILLDFLDTIANMGDNREFLQVKSLGGMEYLKVILLDFRDTIANMGVGLVSSKDGQGQGANKTTPSTNPMEALMQGMSQLQAAMAMQMGMAANKPEVIRPGVSGAELPKLPEADEQAAINVGDWLHGLAGPMGDLTDGSSRWWSEVLVSLDNFYRDYVAASTVKKVQMKAEDYATAELRDVKWTRLDKRAASMLLQAVPDGLKAELMANRLSSTISILGRILTIYRPGSAAERQQVLRALENPGGGNSPSELVEVLRRWMRWLKRAQDLGLQVPDASILLKGLDTATKHQLERNTEIVFRSNMLRYSLDLDASPSITNVLRYHGHLLAEFEQLSFRGRSRTGGPTLPTVKNVSTPNETGAGNTPKTGTSPTTGTSSKPCKFFLSDTGCQRAACRFLHDWQGVPREDRSDKCKNCGAKGHMKKFCPLKGSEGNRRTEEARPSGPPRIKNVSQEKREDGTIPTGEAPATSSGSAAASSSSTTPPTTMTIPSSTSPTTMPSNEEFLRNATQILKMMAEQSSMSTTMPSTKMLQKAVTEMEAKMALVDSGATHPLRQVTVPEWDTSNEVDVLIAGDGVARMRQNDTGTVLTAPTAPRTQTILPVGGLVSILGYELVWTKKKCALRSPEGREIPLRVTSGCPEINEATALELIGKIEEEKLQQLEGWEQWESSLREFVDKGKFEDGFRALVSMPWLKNVPREDLVKVVMDMPRSDEEAWGLMKQWGCNRRFRKLLVHKDWVVKLYSGPKGQIDKIFRSMDSNNTVVVDVDLARGLQMDMLKYEDGIFRLLLWGATTGRVAATMAGLPNQHSDLHLLKLMTLTETAREGRRRICEASDIPNDGVATTIWGSSEVEENPSARALQRGWVKQWVAETGFNRLYFDQGGLGHPLRQPTSMITNMDITELRGVRDERTKEGEEIYQFAWAPMMAHILVRGWKRWKQRPGWYSHMVKALRAVDRKAWERHLANDHVPHRPDCLQCIHNATGRPHRRCLHKDCYVMSADTLGPVRVPGPKGEKYAIVFTFQYPKQKQCPEDTPISEEDLVGWDLDVEEPKDSRPVYEEDGKENLFDEVDFEEYEPSVVEEAENEVEAIYGDVDIEEPALRPVRTKEETLKEDWWEFREAAGVLIRHHEVPRKMLFRPTSTNGCPVHTARLEDTRVTEIKYQGGGVETEISDWHGPKSGTRSLGSCWTGTTRFRISNAEVPEDEEVLQQDEDQWEKLIGDLVKPVEMETIYMVYPVRSKRGGDAMVAIQEAVLRLKLLGFPVARLHTDRGSEYASRGLRRWLLDHDIYHTRSEALVPQTNGAAERGVRWFKTRAKVLLAEAGVNVKYWTLAMQHAANRRIHDRLGLSKPMLLPFGSDVMIRRKVFGNNKKYDLTDRWEEGKYLGMSDTIKGGAIVLRPSGLLTETLNLRTGVVDPRVLLSAEKDEGGGALCDGESPIVDLPEPDHRLKGKETPPNLAKLEVYNEDKPVASGWKMKSMIDRQEQRAKLYYEMGKFDLSSCAQVLEDVDTLAKMKYKTRGMQSTSIILGAYVHGGMRGVTKAGKRRPHLTKYLNMVLRMRVAEDLGEDGSWTTIGVFKAADIPPHRDLRNHAGSWNYVVEVGTKSKGGLWVANGNTEPTIRGGEGLQPLAREQPDGKIVYGNLVDIGGRAVAFNAKELHAYLVQEPERWVIAAFTPLS